MDIVRLYQDYNVDFVTEGHKHSRPGWANVECPWCTGNPGYHLGYELEGNYFYCWRCGWHPIVHTVARLINLSEQEVRKLIRSYGLLVSKFPTPPPMKVRAKAHRLPSNTDVLKENHRAYLIKRGFDPERLMREWFIVGTGTFSRLDHLDFKHRIVIPILWNGQEVSFTSRDITERHPLRYISCPQDRELIPHKAILYGKPGRWHGVGVCVEGPTDVWRFGINSFATFGIKYTPVQLRLIAHKFTRVAVCYDDDPQAIIQANKLVKELRFRAVDAFCVDIKGDPGSMKQADADYLIKQLTK